MLSENVQFYQISVEFATKCFMEFEFNFQNGPIIFQSFIVN